jgi:hypothetical protein
LIEFDAILVIYIWLEAMKKMGFGDDFMLAVMVFLEPAFHPAHGALCFAANNGRIEIFLQNILNNLAGIPIDLLEIFINNVV